VNHFKKEIAERRSIQIMSQDGGTRRLQHEALGMIAGDQQVPGQAVRIMKALRNLQGDKLSLGFGSERVQSTVDAV
jgi:hypothetical protein